MHRIRSQNAMRAAGICQICNLDFPTHLGRSRSETLLYTENGCSDNVDLEELQNNLLLTSHFTHPSE